MDSNERENTDSKAEFQNSSNYGAKRKYRRRSPVGNSSSSDGSPQRNHGLRPIPSRKDSLKVANDERKHDDYRDLGRNHSRSLAVRSGESYKYSNRPSSRSHHRLDDDYDRHYYKPSRYSGRDSREDHHSDYPRGDKDHRSRTFFDDKYCKEKSDGSGHKSRGHEGKDGDSEEGGGRYEKTGHRSLGDYRRDSSGYQSKKASAGEIKDADGEKLINTEKKRWDDGSEFKEPGNEVICNHSANGEPFSSEDKDSVTNKPKMFTNSEGSKANGTSDQAYVKDSDIDAAKIAAMKAAELVNKNLVGTGYMSTDQKKKLLWGNKKNTASEEASHRWDMTMFGDGERQEKFNKLMGVKGDKNLKHKPDNPDVEKQREQLQIELERQYTAGLRRKDGRTIGLGL